MNTPPEPTDLEEITRFLHRFADLMSNGSNAENLLRAARGALIEVGTPDGWRGMAVACNPVCSSQDTLADTISFSVARNPVMLPP
jgi:hypothetical protein